MNCEIIFLKTIEFEDVGLCDIMCDSTTPDSSLRDPPGKSAKFQPTVEIDDNCSDLPSKLYDICILAPQFREQFEYILQLTREFKTRLGSSKTENEFVIHSVCTLLHKMCSLESDVREMCSIVRELKKVQL